MAGISAEERRARRRRRLEEERRRPGRSRSADSGRRRIRRRSADAGEDFNEQDDDRLAKDPHLTRESAMDDLLCLIDFIDTDLEEKLAYLASKECQKVSFSDI